MATFHMHSLLGFRPDGTAIVSEDDCWVELTPALYRTVLAEVRADRAQRLLRALALATQLPLAPAGVQVHFVEYDLPVCVLEAPAAWDVIATPLVADPQASPHRPAREHPGLCRRNRLPAADGRTVCLFPVLLAPGPPPRALGESPLLAHELVHLRKTLTPVYGEPALRLSDWNADLEGYARTRFDALLRHRLAAFLEEEWEACAANLTPADRARAFTDRYIPLALQACAEQLDWWLNDEGRYLNAGRTSTLIATALGAVLAGLVYHDNGRSLADWQAVATRVFREAFRTWQKQPGDFTQILTTILQR